MFKSSGEAASALVRQENFYEPDMKNHAVYMEEYARWRELYKRGLELVGDGLVKSMWQPPGTLTQTQKANPWNLK